MINYSNAYIELELMILVKYNNDDKLPCLKKLILKIHMK